MSDPSRIDAGQIANYDPERKGIFIHRDQLADSPFSTGDRFSLRKGKHQIFSITIIRDDTGDIFFDKSGLFIQRSRRIDILLGGIFEQFVFEIEPEFSRSIKIRPLEIVLEADKNWT
jgi:hypothetical protein